MKYMIVEGINPFSIILLLIIKTFNKFSKKTKKNIIMEIEKHLMTYELAIFSFPLK
jgi:hypothetical protein